MDFKVERNDITNMQVDAIVLPANTHLAEGSGLSAVIFGKAGREQLMADCARIGEVEVGKAAVTEAYDLHSDYIIHAVVPTSGGTDSAQEDCELLSKAYLSALRLADELRCTSIAMPLLGAGNNGFELDTAVQVAINSLEVYVPSYNLSDATLVVFDSQANSHMIRLGYDVEQMIDQAYVNKQDDALKPLIVHQVGGVLNGAAGAVFGGVAALGDFLGGAAQAVGDAVAGAAQFAGGAVADGAMAAGGALADGALAAGGMLADGVQAAGKLAGDAAQAVAQYVNDNPKIQEALADMALDAVGAIVANKLKSK